MSIYLPIYGLAIGIVLGIVVGGIVEAQIVGIVAGVVFGILFLALWIYSPLPSTNGGMFAPPARWQQWGWTNKPAKSYEETEPEDYMSAKFIGINWAKEKNGDDK